MALEYLKSIFSRQNDDSRSNYTRLKPNRLDSSSDDVFDLESNSSHLSGTIFDRRSAGSEAKSIKTRSFMSPKMLADLTLGFADGLTVPFALTAGLSALGDSKTVVYGGLAEIVAGMISMGLGGYLSAKGEVEHAERVARKRKGGVECSSKSRAIEEIVAPLGLATELEQQVLQVLSDRPIESLLPLVRKEGGTDDSKAINSPWMTGLTIAMGYVFGGLVPLLPYVFTTTVGAGFRWSVAVCLIALFGFGFGKAMASDDDGEEEFGSVAPKKRSKAVRDGIQMLVLGSIAAGASIACVQLLDPGS